jgi:hypothetical protein
MKGIQGSRCPRHPDIISRHNRAKRGSRKRPDPPLIRRARACHDAPDSTAHHHHSHPITELSARCRIVVRTVSTRALEY